VLKLGKHTLLAIGILAGGVIFIVFAGVVIYKKWCKKGRKNQIQSVDEDTPLTVSACPAGNKSDKPSSSPSKALETNTKAKKEKDDDNDSW